VARDKGQKKKVGIARDLARRPFPSRAMDGEGNNSMRPRKAEFLPGKRHERPRGESSSKLGAVDLSLPLVRPSRP
jgi:hypothetical protein